MNAYKGKLITFEGGEGSGKSTQIALLKDYLEKKKYDIVVSREPGGTEISEQIRTLVKDPKYNGIMSMRAELLLYEAARCQIVDQNLKPWLREGKIVIFDRFYDSTTVYQGYGRGLDMDLIKVLNQFATDGIKPDLTILLDVPVDVGFSRTNVRDSGMKDRLESAGLNFHKKIRKGYKKLASTEDRFKVVYTGFSDADGVHEYVRKHVDRLLK